MAALPPLSPLIHHLTDGLVEREGAVRVALVGALAGENVLLLGPPGTAKSMLARRVASAFADARYFQYLLTRFTTPDELFGPVSLRELREHDAYARKVAGYLPTADVAFVDEVFKASSAILNSLLTLVNERLYFNGAQVVRAPLLVLLAAANEVPAEEELTAFYDRFSVRVLVEPVGDAEGLLQLVRAPGAVEDAEVPEALRVPLDAVRRLREEAGDLPLAPAVERVVVRVKRELDGLALASPDDPWRWYVSDRRWRHAVRLLRVAARADGRGSVGLVDCALLKHCLWNRPDDAGTVAQRVDLALEEAGPSVDPRLPEVQAAWLKLLTEMRDTEGVGRPIVDGFVFTHGANRVVMTDLRALAATQNQWDTVRSTGFYYDARSGTIRKVKTRADGSVVFPSGYGVQPVNDAATWGAFIRAGSAPQFEEGAVTVERKVSPGMAVRFDGADPATLDAWRAEVERLRTWVAQRDALRSAEAADLNRLAVSHPFVPAAELGGLFAGQVRLDLALREWSGKLAAMAEALWSDRLYETADLEAARVISPEEALRELVSVAG